MFYKVIKNRNVIDVLSSIQFVKFQPKHKILLLCDEEHAQGILSSTGDTAYHIPSLEPFPVDDFATVTLEEITEHEYNQLKQAHCMSPEEIIDNYTMNLFEQGVL
nr:MAG TPA: hypothetical protein [Caudoviricetes sp.]